MLVKCMRFYPTLAYFDRKNKGIGDKSQSWDKILYILVASIKDIVMFRGCEQQIIITTHTHT